MRGGIRRLAPGFIYKPCLARRIILQSTPPQEKKTRDSYAPVDDKQPVVQEDGEYADDLPVTHDSLRLADQVSTEVMDKKYYSYWNTKYWTEIHENQFYLGK